MSIHSKLFLFGLSALLVSACGGEDPADEYREAVPTRGQLSMNVPSGGGSQGQSEVGSLSQALLGQQAELYRLTYEVSRDVNSSIWVGLNTIESIVQTQPSAVANNTAVWGPHTPALEPLTWQLVVSKTGPGRYSYVLSARKKGDATGQFLPILAGTSQKGVSQYFSGYKGVYTANADNLNALAPALHPDTGKMIATYDTTGDQRSVKMALQDYSENGAPPADILYSYLDRLDTSGEFGFVAHTDMQKDGSAEELCVATSQWDATGAGRGDAVVTGGDIPAGVQIEITECWDASFGRTFYQDNHGINPAEGSASTCAFSQPAK